MRHFIAACLALSLTACATTGGMTKQKREKLATIHYQIGVDALQKGILPRAFDELLEANELDPNRPEVLDALGLAWRLRGDAKKAEFYYKKALRHGAGAATHTNYANLLNALGRYKEAEREARKALDDPRYRNMHLALVNLGDALLGQKRYTEAFDAYRQAEAFAPDDPTIKLHKAHAYAVTGRKHLALALLRSLQKRFGDQRAIVAAIVDEMLAMQAFNEARQVLAEFIDRTKRDIDRAWAKDKLIEIAEKMQ